MKPAIPQWFAPILQSMVSRWAHKTGWDSYRALPTNPRNAVALLNCLLAVTRDGYPFPTITPLRDGGLQAEWDDGTASLEIIVSLEVGRPRFYAEINGKSSGGAVASNVKRLRDMISRIGKEV